MMASEMTPAQTFLRTPEVARFLGLSPKTLEKKRVIGGGPVYRKHGRVVVYLRRDLLRWSDQQVRQSTSEKIEAG